MNHVDIEDEFYSRKRKLLLVYRHIILQKLIDSLMTFIRGILRRMETPDLIVPKSIISERKFPDIFEHNHKSRKKKMGLDQYRHSCHLEDVKHDGLNCCKYQKCKSRKTCQNCDLHKNNRRHRCTCRVCFVGIYYTLTSYGFTINRCCLYEDLCVEDIIELTQFFDIFSIFTYDDISLLRRDGGNLDGFPLVWMIRASTVNMHELSTLVGSLVPYIPQRSKLLGTISALNKCLVIISPYLQKNQLLLETIRFRIFCNYTNFHFICKKSLCLQYTRIFLIIQNVEESHEKQIASMKKVDDKKLEINSNEIPALCNDKVAKLKSVNDELQLIQTKEYKEEYSPSVKEQLNLIKNFFLGNNNVHAETYGAVEKANSVKKTKKDNRNSKSIFNDETWDTLFDRVEVRPVEIQAYPASQPVLEPILKKFSNSQSKPTRHDTMAVEFLRLCTMHDYPNSNGPSLLRLAEAGFYFEGEGNTLVCFSCHVKRGNWEYSESPREVHRQISPNCPFLNSGDGNIPVPRENGRDLVPLERNGGDVVTDGMSTLAINGAPTAAYASNHVAHLASSSSSNSSTAASYNEVDSAQRPARKVILVKHPEYANRSTRLSSYANFPRHMKQHPADMTEAGFYYAGFGDCCRCFHCGIGLRNWDPEDNPWIEHARWSAECPYILRIKGQAFIDLVQEAARAAEMREDGVNGDSNGSPADSLGNNEAAKFVKGDMAESQSTDNTTSSSSAATASGGNNVVSTSEATISSGDSGYGSGAKTDPSGGLRSEIKPIKVPIRTEAAQSLINDHKYKPKLVTEAIQELVEKEGWSAFSKENIQKYIKTETKDSATGSRENADPETLKQENKELKDLTMCKICLDEKVSIVFLPCGHLVACPQCAPALTKCPICRKGIKGTVRTNLVDKQSVESR